MWFVRHIWCLGLNTESEIAYSNTVFLLTPIILQRVDVTSNHNNDAPCSKSQNDFCSFRRVIWLLTQCFKLISFFYIYIKYLWFEDSYKSSRCNMLKTFAHTWCYRDCPVRTVFAIILFWLRNTNSTVYFPASIHWENNQMPKPYSGVTWDRNASYFCLLCQPVYLIFRQVHHGSSCLLSSQSSPPPRSSAVTSRLRPSRSATAPSYNMVFIIASIKSNKPGFPTTPYIQRLVSLLPISIAVVSLYSAYLCVSVCVCVSMFLSVCYYCFFFSLSYSSIQLSLAASLFNKLTRYSLNF